MSSIFGIRYLSIMVLVVKEQCVILMHWQVPWCLYYLLQV